MALTAAEHRAIQAERKANRTAAARNNRAAGAHLYRKVHIHVTVIRTVDQDGAPVLLATSDAPAESGRYLRLSSQSGR